MKIRQNYEYVLVGAVKGLTEARGNLNAKTLPNEDLLKQWLSCFIDDLAVIDNVVKTVNQRGTAFCESTNKLVVPTCFRVMTRDYFESLI